MYILSNISFANASTVSGVQTIAPDYQQVLQLLPTVCGTYILVPQLFLAWSTCTLIRHSVRSRTPADKALPFSCFANCVEAVGPNQPRGLGLQRDGRLLLETHLIADQLEPRLVHLEGSHESQHLLGHGRQFVVVSDGTDGERVSSVI